MIRLILFVVVGLLAGLGAGTGFAVLKAKSAFGAESARRAKVVADSLAEHPEPKTPATQHASAPNEPAADASAHTDESSAEPAAKPVSSQVKGTQVGVAPAQVMPSEPAHKGSPAPSAPTHTETAPPKHTPGEAEHAANAGAPSAPRPPVTSGATKGDETVQPKRIAKIFASMPARDAAKVLVQMDDADVHLILDALGEKQAAAILQNFPADRAATISKGAIRGTKAP